MKLTKENDIREQKVDIKNKYCYFSTSISNLPQKYLDFINSATAICPKLVLTGQLSFHLLGIENYDFHTRKPDLDFALTEPLTLEDLDFLKGFFDLKILDRNGYITDDSNVTLLKGKLISFIYKQATPDEIIIDIFTEQVTDNLVNLIPVITVSSEDPHVIYIQHPKIAISHKALYAFTENYHKKNKHKDDLIDLLCKNYGVFTKKMDFMSSLRSNYLYFLEYTYNGKSTGLDIKLPF
jgi:hypothetical protein